jgi:hypothetical protein
MNRNIRLRLLVVTALCAVLLSACLAETLAPADEDCLAVPAGLVSWWPFEVNLEDSAGRNDGTAVGSESYAAGMVDLAFSFEDGDRVYAPTVKLPTGSEDRTLELWVKLSSFTEGEDFFAGYGNFGKMEETFHLGTAYSTLFFSQWGSAIYGPNLETERWYHVAVTLEDSYATLYLDGTPVANATMIVNTPADTVFYMGGVAGEGSKYLDGSLDEVSVYDRALSAGEISALYAAGVGGKCKK